MSFNILLVDDDALVRESIRRVLEYNKLKVTTVCCINDAKEVLGKCEFSALISDVHMPDGTGVELHEWVAEHCPYLSRKFIFCSGGMSSELEAYISKSGCRLFNKPIDWNALVEAIHAVRPSSSPKLIASDGVTTRGL
jgi:DNA-binding NtrC family response regulator